MGVRVAQAIAECHEDIVRLTKRLVRMGEQRERYHELVTSLRNELKVALAELDKVMEMAGE